MIFKKSSDISSNIKFAVRSEFEEENANKEYIKGYLKGVQSALFDLGFSLREVKKVMENLLFVRFYVEGKYDEELE